MSIIKNFWKKLFGRQQSNPIPYSPSEYTGPKEFANQPAVDYLLKHVKYQALPELSGRAIPFKSLLTIEEDIQKALKNEYPDLGSITICENLRPTWHGSLVSPKYIHFSEQRMQVDFHTVNAECKAITLEDLEYLCFLDRRTDEWLHNKDYTTNDKFFPAELIIREACLTNWLRDGQSCVYSHRYFYL